VFGRFLPVRLILPLALAHSVWPFLAGCCPGAEAAKPMGDAIVSGYFFNAGRYVPPPYRVTIDDQGIMINGVSVEPAPRPPKGIPIPKEDPGPFQWNPERLARGMHESGFVIHAMSRFRYWESQYGFAEACKRFIPYLREQPLVSRVGTDGDGDFAVSYWTKDGKRNGFGFSRAKPLNRGPQGPPNAPGIRTRENADEQERMLEAKAEAIERQLSAGGAILLGPGELFLPRAAVKAYLSRIYDIATSGVSRKDKVDALVSEAMIVSPDMAKAFVEGFVDSANLQERIRTLRGEPKH